MYAAIDEGAVSTVASDRTRDAASAAPLVGPEPLYPAPEVPPMRPVPRIGVWLAVLAGPWLLLAALLALLLG
ncbi:MAG TPA: hypothetical protein VEB20_06985 [Azospirillaceae bacterium]|nr:hypothetical protein [Azospirillaceae bacterium]